MYAPYMAYAGGQGAITSEQAIVLLVVFSEPVTGLTTANFQASQILKAVKVWMLFGHWLGLAGKRTLRGERYGAQAATGDLLILPPGHPNSCVLLRHSHSLICGALLKASGKQCLSM